MINVIVYTSEDNEYSQEAAEILHRLSDELKFHLQEINVDLDEELNKKKAMFRSRTWPLNSFF